MMYLGLDEQTASDNAGGFVFWDTRLLGEDLNLQPTG